VALGFPDILFEPEDAFVQMKNNLLAGDADVLLGLVPSDQSQRSDMISFNEQGKIQEIVIKQNRPDLKYSWFIALWKPSFTRYMNEYLENLIRINPQGQIVLQDGSAREVFVGDVIQSAIKTGLTAGYQIFENGKFTDMGTTAELVKWGFAK
jgi:glucose-1-phosphate thymidylyltransferase